VAVWSLRPGGRNGVRSLPRYGKAREDIQEQVAGQPQPAIDIRLMTGVCRDKETMPRANSVREMPPGAEGEARQASSQTTPP